MTTFKDNFSKQAALYAKLRPHYPEAMYDFLAGLTSSHELVWDCGTGNGQAAIGLIRHFKKVIATDPSEEQISHCMPHEGIEYRVEKAEQNSIASGSTDLVTIANAMHWFDLDHFYSEVKRVGKKDAAIAAWCYGPPSISPAIDQVVMRFHDETLNDYWQPENRLVEKEYNTIPFPFETIEAPFFYSSRKMDRVTFLSYLHTWSAVQRFIANQGKDPVALLEEELASLWQNVAEEKTVSWKIILKAGRINNQ